MSSSELALKIIAQDSATTVIKNLNVTLKGLPPAVEDATKGAAKMGQEFTTAATHTSSLTKNIGGLVDGLAKVGMGAFGIKALADTVGGFVGGLVSGNAEFERYNVQFGVLLGSSEAAKDRLAELADFGQKTPFELPELVRADKVLTAFGLDSKDTAERFGVSAAQIRETIGDVASGTGTHFEELAVTFGKFASGATGEAIQRFQELGIATREQMASWGLEFSKSGELLTPARQAFTILEEHVRGKFGGMMKAQSQTFEGMMSNLSDWWGATQRKLTAPLFEVLKDKLQGILDWLGSADAQKALEGFANALAGGMQLAIDIGGKLADVFGPIIKAGLDLVGVFTSSEGAGLSLHNALERMLGLPMANYIIEIVRSAENLRDILVDLVGNAIANLVSIVQSNLQPILAGLAGVVAAVVIPAFLAWAASAAAAGIATIIALAPVLVPLALIGAAAAALYLAWDSNFLGIRDVTEQVMKAISQVINTVLNAVMPFFTEIAGIVVAWMNENWPLIQKVVDVVMTAINAQITTVMNIIQAVFQTVLATIQSIWQEHGDQIMTIVTALWEIVKTIIETALRNILDIIKIAMQLITGDWQGAWDTFNGILQRSWDAITQIIAPNALTALSGILNLEIEAIKTIATNIGNAIINGITAGIEAGWKWLTDLVSNLAEEMLKSAKKALGISSPSKEFFKLGENIIQGLIGGIKSRNTSFIDAVRDTMGNTIKLMDSLIDRTVGGWNSSILSRGASAAESFLKNFQSMNGAEILFGFPTLPGIFSQISQASKDMAMVGQIKDVIDAMREMGMSINSDVIQQFKNLGQDLSGPVRDQLYKFLDTFKEQDALKGLKDFLADADLGRQLASTASQLQSLGQTMPESLKQLLINVPRIEGGILDTVIKQILNGAIPGFATGGIVPGPIGRPMLALVHGGESIAPAGQNGNIYNFNLTVNSNAGSDQTIANFALMRAMAGA